LPKCRVTPSTSIDFFVVVFNVRSLTTDLAENLCR
jgi:hypothetical protein